MIRILNTYKFILLLMLQVFVLHAQKVANVTNRQEKSTIIVSYDLETKTPCKIALYVSTNGGTTWQGPLQKVTGNVGAKVSSGANSITWNVLEEFEELRGNNIVFQVRAASNATQNIETVKIGTQEWTKKNLDVTTYRNGDVIPEVKDPDEWANLTTGAWCYYDNDPKNGEIYGKLYNWYAVNDPRGLAPEGFHIPSWAEWDKIVENVGGENLAVDKMKEKGLDHWKSPNQDATNSSGFSGLPGGRRYYDGDCSFENIGFDGYWWCNKRECQAYFNLPSKPKEHYILYIAGISCGVSEKFGFSVRCVKNK